MLKAFAFLGMKRSSRRFKDYYSEWFKSLKNVHLPQLRRAMSSTTVSPEPLSAQVEAMQRHFIAYYEALDLAALEKPFLWLSDLHPYLFTNLLRSFLDVEGSDEEEGKSWEISDQPWYLAKAWRSPPKTLTTRVDQIDCGLRLMVPALVGRARHAQAAFVDRVGREWGCCEGRSEEAKSAIGEYVAAEMDELVMFSRMLKACGGNKKIWRKFDGGLRRKLEEVRNYQKTPYLTVN